MSFDRRLRRISNPSPITSPKTTRPGQFQELREKCRVLAEMPKSAPARPELGEDIRSRPAGNYVIYYRPVSGGVEIIRILHGRREVDPDIFDD